MQATDPGCVVEREVRAALDERFGREEGSTPWRLAYRAQTRARDVELEVVLTSGAVVVLRRDVTVAAADCASTPALMAAMVERYFRGIGWTAGAPLPALATKPEETASAPADQKAGDDERAAESAGERGTEPAPPRDGDRAKAQGKPPESPREPASSRPPDDARASSHRPAWTLRGLAALTSYPSLQPTAALSVSMRLAWLAPEAMLWLPTATTTSIPPRGTAHLDAWTAQVWWTAAFDTAPVTWRAGVVTGLGFESASTSNLDRPNQRGRAAFDLGLGAHATWLFTRAFGAGVTAWGGRTLAEPEFFVDGPNGTISLGSPWKAGWKGALGLHVDFEFFH